jgi:hypothetical protein
MSALFGGGSSKEKTVALMDIESGSVGAALARISRKDAPRLFGEVRIDIPVKHTRSTEALALEIEKAMREAMSHISAVAARMRNTEPLSRLGAVGRALLFFSPPWASMHLEGGSAQFYEPMRAFGQGVVENHFGTIPTTVHPLGTIAAHGAVQLYPSDTPQLLCIVCGEVSEMLVLTSGALLGRGTIPVGTNTLLRTLVMHGGVSAQEAQSYLRMAERTAHPLAEPLSAAQSHFATEFTDVARDLNGENPFAGIIVMAPHTHADIFAHALTGHEPLQALFPEGGVVRSFRPQHLMPYLAGHAPRPDLPLMLGSLFAQAKFAGI